MLTSSSGSGLYACRGRHDSPQLQADEAVVHTQAFNAADRTKYFRLPPHPGTQVAVL
jgi:hypothetical protein